MEQLLPKKYSEWNHDIIIGRKYWVHSTKLDGWAILKFNCFYQGWMLKTGEIVDTADWFINIPDAPEEIKPLEYPKHKPSTRGVYIIYDPKWNIWRPLNWDGEWYVNYGLIFADYPNEISYFIPTNFVLTRASDEEDTTTDNSGNYSIENLDISHWCELLSELGELREERTKRLHLEIKRLREGYDRIRGLAAGIKIAGHETLADGLVELVDEILEEE